MTAGRRKWTATPEARGRAGVAASGGEQMSHARTGSRPTSAIRGVLETLEDRSVPSASPLTVGSSQFQVAADQYRVSEGAGQVAITVTRTGDLSQTAAVEVFRQGGSATPWTDFSGLGIV